jgi:hypothetical protein
MQLNLKGKVAIVTGKPRKVYHQTVIGLIPRKAERKESDGPLLKLCMMFSSDARVVKRY